MIPTETEGPAKLAWHKSTRIKKKELQSDFTQDFGLDPEECLNSAEAVAHRRIEPAPVSRVLIGSVGVPAFPPPARECSPEEETRREIELRRSRVGRR